MVVIKVIEFEDKPWALCASKVVVSIDGESFPVRLCTGGAVWFDENWCEHVDSGPWSVMNIPSQFKHLEKEIVEVINKSIPWGCCGGCV